MTLSPQGVWQDFRVPEGCDGSQAPLGAVAHGADLWGSWGPWRLCPVAAAQPLLCCDSKPCGIETLLEGCAVILFRIYLRKKKSLVGDCFGNVSKWPEKPENVKDQLFSQCPVPPSVLRCPSPSAADAVKILLSVLELRHALLGIGL